MEIDLPLIFQSSELEQGQRLDATFHESGIEAAYRLYVAENHVDTYSYPVVAYLHETEQSEQDLKNWFPAISDQNFIGLGVRAPFPHPLGFPGKYSWKMERPDASLAAVRDSLYSLESGWAIHPDRVYLFGEGYGAVAALQYLILQQTLGVHSPPIAGVICRSLPKNWSAWLPYFEEGLSGRLLILDPTQSAGDQAALDALDEAGLAMTFNTNAASDGDSGLINQWIMSSISTAIM